MEGGGGGLRVKKGAVEVIQFVCECPITLREHKRTYEQTKL